MQDRTHIIFCGTPRFAVPSLEALAKESGYSIDLVITQPSKPVGREQKVTPTPVRIAAEQLGIPVAEMKSLNKEWADYRDAHPEIPEPDFLVVVAFGQILSKEILSIPKIAPVNVHASLLPKLRGASPIQHSILQNDHAGVTLQKMEESLDAGPVIAQRKVTIDPRETSATLHDKLSLIGAELLTVTLAEPLTFVKQEESQATFCKKLTRADGIIDPEVMTAEEIDRKVRALVPWPGARLNDVKVIEAVLTPDEETVPLSCAKDTTLFLKKVQPDGKKVMTGAEWQRGRKT